MYLKNFEYSKYPNILIFIIFIINYNMKVKIFKYAKNFEYLILKFLFFFQTLFTVSSKTMFVFFISQVATVEFHYFFDFL